MGSAITTAETTIPGRSGQENQLLQILAALGKDAGAQFGDLSALAAGDVSRLGPQSQDVELVRRSIGATRDIAKRELEELLPQMLAALGENLSARGVQGSSIEAVKKGGVVSGAQRSIADLISGASAQGGQALLNLPFQRAETQLNANQALFQRLIGSLGPALQFGLQERLGQSTTTQETPFNFGQGLQLGTGIAGTIPGAGGGG